LEEISFMLITSIGTADSVTVLGAPREPSIIRLSNSPLSAKYVNGAPVTLCFFAFHIQ
jgi:hypothetical protein